MTQIECEHYVEAGLEKLLKEGVVRFVTAGNDVPIFCLKSRIGEEILFTDFSLLEA